MNLFHPRKHNRISHNTHFFFHFLRFARKKILNEENRNFEIEQIKWLVQMEQKKKNVRVQMQALVLAMHTLSLIHEGTIL